MTSKDRAATHCGCHLWLGHPPLVCPLCTHTVRHLSGLFLHLSTHGLYAGRRVTSLALDVARAEVRGLDARQLRESLGRALNQTACQPDLQHGQARALIRFIEGWSVTDECCPSVDPAGQLLPPIGGIAVESAQSRYRAEPASELPADAKDPTVDLRKLKRAASRLPERDPVRQLIDAEPDFLPMSILAAKADSWVLLLFRPGD